MKKKILVVDDEESVLNMMQTLLSLKGGYDTVPATNAAEMFQRLNESPVDLVLLDVMLPDANGLDLLPLIKNGHPAVPVLVLSALGFEEDFVTEARRCGAAGFLKKTMAPDELLAEVGRAVTAG